MNGRNDRSPEPICPISQNGYISNDDHEFFRATTSTASKEWNAEFASEPAEWENAFLKCWHRLKAILFAKPKPNDRDAFHEIKALLHKMCNYLIMEVTSQPEPIIGPILEHCFNDDIFHHLYKWATRTSFAIIPRCQVMLMEMYEFLIDGAQSSSHYLLIHKPVLIPLLRLLAWCQRTSKERLVPSSEVDKYFVRLLNQICKKISEESNLLELFFNSQISSEWEFYENSEENSNGANEKEEDVGSSFLVFNLLISYMHTADDTGQLARDALLQIMSVSRRFEYVAKHVAESEFCAVLATGLSGFWSQLPKCICTALNILNVDEFHKLNVQTDLDGSVTELVEFQKALLFCNAVAQDAHVEITRQIIHYFYDGFLCRVVKAAVEQLDDEELVSIIVYFHLCLDTVTEESLIQALLKVLIVADTSSKDMNLLEVILSRMNDNEKLCRVVLSFLRTLLELRCEDLMWSCLLRFILPFIPLKATRRFDVNISLNAADHFLNCIPKCTHNIAELNSNETFGRYLKEAAENIQESTDFCKSWAFKYDGIKPNLLLNMSAPEELLSTRQPFIRLSSARSSFASNGLNRYFQNRFAHGTQESLLNNDFSNNGSMLLPPLNKLGEDDSKELLQTRSYDKFDTFLDPGQDDFSDYHSQYDLMSAADNLQLDYFHFTYEGISSESDEMNNSRRNSTSDDGAATSKSALTLVNSTLDDASVLSQAPPYTQAVLATNWETATRDLDIYCKALNALPSSNGKMVTMNQLRTSNYSHAYFSKFGGNAASVTPPTVDENIALIEARFQYLKEVNAERTQLLENNPCLLAGETHNSFRLDFGTGENAIQQSMSSGFISGTAHSGMCTSAASISATSTMPLQASGLLLTCTDERGSGLFLESLFSALEKLVDRSFTTNLQLVGVLGVLISYPQPVITSYLLYVDAIKSNALFRITNILESLKTRIDAYASSTDGFEEMMRRGAQNKITRAHRFEKSGWMTPDVSPSSSIFPLSSSSTNGLGSQVTQRFNQTPQYYSYRRRIGGYRAANASATSNGLMTNTSSSARLFRHKTVESQEQSVDMSRTRNFAYAAILLSQLCQMCAAMALQHSTPPLFNNNANLPSNLPSASAASFSIASTPGR